ncbi:glutamate dehydrogenase, partial [Mycobacterium tuberculosis]
YMTGMMKKITNNAACVFTGKGLSYGGSLMRPEATGFGTVYFVEQMLHHARRDTDGAKVLISGAGNVAQHAAIKAIELGAKVLTLSDSGGTLYARDGFDDAALQEV